MTLMHTLQEIATLQREIEQQLRIIDAFTQKNRNNMSLVRTELRGSTKGYDATMVRSLDAAEASLKKSAAALRTASDALQRVRAI